MLQWLLFLELQLPSSLLDLLYVPALSSAAMETDSASQTFFKMGLFGPC